MVPATAITLKPINPNALSTTSGDASERKYFKYIFLKQTSFLFYIRASWPQLHRSCWFVGTFPANYSLVKKCILGMNEVSLHCLHFEKKLFKQNKGTFPPLDISVPGVLIQTQWRSCAPACLSQPRRMTCPPCRSSCSCTDSSAEWDSSEFVKCILSKSQFIELQLNNY